MQAILKLALRILLLTKLKDYRRIIGVAGLAGSLIIEKGLCDPNSGLHNVCSEGLVALLPYLQMLGVYAGTVGVVDKSGKLTSLATAPAATGDIQRPGA